MRVCGAFSLSLFCVVVFCVFFVVNLLLTPAHQACSPAIPGDVFSFHMLSWRVVQLDALCRPVSFIIYFIIIFSF